MRQSGRSCRVHRDYVNPFTKNQENAVKLEFPSRAERCERRRASIAEGARRGAGVPAESNMVLIFGKDGCPYTQNARDDFASRKVAAEYINVKKNPAELERMLGYS